MWLVLLLCVGQAAAPQEKSAEEGISFELRVNRAIALGVDYLKSRQQADGSYRAYEGEHPGGATALVAYTLSKSGVRKNDDALLRALQSLRYVSFRSTYSASVHLLMCESLRDPARRDEAQRSLDFLLEHREEGVWGYPGKHLCNSNSQFALLGLRAARRMGLEIREEVWLQALEGLKVFDDPSGGFLYAPSQKDVYAGITAAGLASLAVFEEVANDSPRLRAALEKRAEVRRRAEEWSEDHFDPARNTWEDGTWWKNVHYAYLWALERWCGLSEKKLLGKRDWYREGAEWLLSMQGRDGAFGSERALENTCFALLFLRRATVSLPGELAEIYAEIDRLREARPVLLGRPSSEALRLTEWWLAGPWLANGQGPLLLDPPFDPATVAPHARAKVAKREWEPVSLRNDTWTDLDLLTDRVGDKQLWLLATRLAVTGSAKVPALLWFEFDDGWDVWLDGARLSRERRRTMPPVDDAVLSVELGPGEHLLAVLVEDRRGMAVFGAQLASAANGAPPAEITPVPCESEKGKRD